MGSYHRNGYVRILTIGNFVLSASPTFTGTITASKITSSSSLSLDSNGGASVIVGANSPKQTGQFNTFIVLNNSTDLNPLFAVQTAGTSTGGNDIFINAPLYLNGVGTGTAGYYLVSGGASSPPTWVSTGGGTFNPAAPGPIGGTTPSTAAFTNISVNRSAGNPYIFWTEGTHYGTLGLATSAGTFFTDSAVADMCIRADSGRVLMGPGTGSTASTAIVGTNGASNALTVNGGSIASTQQSTGFLTPSGQGAYRGWNRSGTGATCFYNQQGLGAGGWEWVGYNSSNVSTGVSMTLTQSTSSLTLAGELTCSSSGSVNTNSGTLNATSLSSNSLSVTGSGANALFSPTVGTTPAISISHNSISVGGSAPLNILSQGASTNNYTIGFYYFNAPTTLVGNISCGSANTVYATSSDYRIKKNVKKISYPFKRLELLNPVEFDFVNGPERVEGFIAHEFQELYPHAVTGQKDDVDENGEIRVQGMDSSFLIPLLTACVQEHQKVLDNMDDGKITAKTLLLEMENDRLKSDLNVANQRIDELESKVETLIALYMKEFHFKKPSFIKTKKQFPH